MQIVDLLNYAINTAVFFAGLLLFYFLVQKIRKVHPGKKRQLQNAACLLYIAFVAGVLWTNDLDYPVARALAVDTVELPAFAQVRSGRFARPAAPVFVCAAKTHCNL